MPSRGSTPEGWSSEEKFRVVLETARMNQAEFSAYCREKGLYPEQVEAWRESCMHANANAAEQNTVALGVDLTARAPVRRRRICLT